MYTIRFEGGFHASGYYPSFEALREAEVPYPFRSVDDALEVARLEYPEDCFELVGPDGARGHHP